MVKRKFDPELDYLRYELKIIQQRVKHLDDQLNVIYSAKTFRWWQWYAAMRRFIYKTAVRPLLKTTKQVVYAVVPVWARKRIKARIERHLYTQKVIYPVDAALKKEWLMWRAKRTNTSCDIFIFSIIAYDFRFQRPQQLAKQLAAKGHRIFYIENVFTPAEAHDGVAPIKVVRHEHNIYKVTLSATSNLFIYRDTPSEKDVAVMAASLKNLLMEAQAVNPIAKIDHPFWSCLLEKLAMPVIYDCMDEHSGFAESGSSIGQLEDKLYHQSDMVIATSNYLETKIKKQKPKHMITVKNAGEYGHFAQAMDKKLSIPADIKAIKHPIIGYYGAIADWFDVGIVEKVAHEYPKASIVLVGNVDNKQVAKLPQKYPNIHLLGEKAYSLLPAYLQQFDVCMIPFQLTDLIKATSPVKIYEYLAAGKPVVTTNMPELKDYEDVIYKTTNNQAFSAAIGRALKEKGQDIQKKRQAVAKQHTWTLRGAALDKAIQAIRFPSVSIIILSYNKVSYTTRCLDSVLDESKYPNMEVIVVDNGSDKETVNGLKKYPHDKRLRFIFNKENLGFGEGNNVGLAAGKGEYLIVLNNDTLITPGWIERLVYHGQMPAVGLVGPVTNAIDNEARIPIRYDITNREDFYSTAGQYTYRHWGEVLDLRMVAAFCWLLPKKVYKQLGGFDPRFGKAFFEDDDYCMRVREAHLTILCADDVFIHHYGSVTVNDTVNQERVSLLRNQLFQVNKRKFEEKWHTTWVPHASR